MNKVERQIERDKKLDEILKLLLEIKAELNKKKK